MAAKKKKYIKRAFSKDQLRSFTWNTKEATVFPDFSFQTVIDMVNDDPTARGATNHFIDKCMEGRYSILKRDTLTYDKDFEQLLQEKYKFRTEILRKEFLVGKLFNNVFIEIVRDTSKTKSLNVLDSLNIDPITDTNGDPISYKSKTPNQKDGKYAKWDAKDIVWIKFGDRTTGFAPVDLKALWETLLIKSYMKRYVAWLWQTGQYRVLYSIKQGASEKDITDFLVYARKNDTNFKAPFILKGDLEMKMVRDISENKDIISLLKYWDSQILVLLRVPPNDAGLPDQSGRSNADQQSNNLSTSVTSMKKIIEDANNYDLFPKMNKANSLMRFAPNDRFEVKQVIENVNLMKNMGMTEELIKEYLEDTGMFFSAKKLFEDPMEGQQQMIKDINTMPSRQKSVDKKQVGTGSEGSTREDQLKKV